MKPIKIPQELYKMNEIFKSGGFCAYLVGGAVRDIALGKKASDWDVATNATPKDVQRLFRKVIPTGIAHGTVTVLLFGKEIEVTTFRTDGDYSDGRHPDDVKFAATIEDDLSRRDFTMNAIAASLFDGKIIDPFGGENDIKQKIIRTVGNPRDRFLEDGLRPIRAIRFSAQLGFKIEEKTLEAISLPEVREKIRSISIERFRDELSKILVSDEPSGAFKIMEKTGILRDFLPELADCRGVAQADRRGFHEFDVLDHSLYACDGSPKNNAVVRLAALFHDIGKKDAKTTERVEIPRGSGEMHEIIHFHKHEQYSAEQVVPILTRLKYPNAVIERTAHLIRHHMFFFNDSWSDAAIRRFIVRVHADCIDDIIYLWYADIYGMHRRAVDAQSQTAQNMIRLKERINKVKEESTALSLKDLAVNGRDLMAVGIPAGKMLGTILNEIFQSVIDDPEMNDREKLLNLAKNLFDRYKIS